MINKPAIWSGTLVLVLFYLSTVSLQPYDDFSDLRGPYCENIGCCRDRKDTCAQPIIGTLCYCDDFCNRTDVHDCCPDYWSVCWGINITTPPPPPTTRAPPSEIRACGYKDLTLRVNQTIRDNCNDCTCMAFGDRSVEMLCETKVCLVDPDIINAVNADIGHGWTATNYSKFWGRTLNEGVRYRLGTLQPQKVVLVMNPVKRFYDPNALPREFDSRQEWPRYIGDIHDQDWCGSSWAISTAAVASDRYGIVSKGIEEVQLSAQNLISCLPKTTGCTGGRLDRAWAYTRKYGVVDEACFPYTGTNQTCSIGRINSLRRTGCTPPKYSDRTERYKVGPAYRLGNETDIMYEILISGPVQATMKVYHDFFSYKGGIYRHTDLSLAHEQGYHSVRIIGWGEEFTSRGYQKYWKVANSWGKDWGEEGYFRIARGSNECEIENFVLATWPEVDRHIFSSTRYRNGNK